MVLLKLHEEVALFWFKKFMFYFQQWLHLPIDTIVFQGWCFMLFSTYTLVNNMISMSRLHFKEAEKNKKAKLTSVQVKQGSLTINTTLCRWKMEEKQLPRYFREVKSTLKSLIIMMMMIPLLKCQNCNSGV